MPRLTGILKCLMEDMANVGRSSHASEFRLLAQEVQESQVRHMEQKTSLADMSSSCRRIHLAHVVPDQGCAQAFTRNVSMPAAGCPIGEWFCDLDSGAAGLDLDVSQGPMSIAEITISTRCDLGSFGSCHRVGFIMRN